MCFRLSALLQVDADGFDPADGADRRDRAAVDHVLLAASVRVLRVDPESELLGRFQDYVQAQFPDYLDNPLLAQLSRSHKLILRLLRQRKYRTVRALFAAKDKLG